MISNVLNESLAVSLGAHQRVRRLVLSKADNIETHTRLCRLYQTTNVPHVLIASFLPSAVGRYVILGLSRISFADWLPPFTACIRPSQYGECNPYDGQCRCPPGWGGQDCMTPRALLPPQALFHTRTRSLTCCIVVVSPFSLWLASGW